MGPELSAVLVSAGVTAGVAVVGGFGVARLGRRNPALAAFGAPIVVVASLAAGVAAASRAMLLGDRDYRVVIFVLLAGAPMAVLIGVLLARRVLDLERQAARERAERERDSQVEAGRRETISWLSHDLRTPLAGIRLLAESLEDGEPDGCSEPTRIIHEVDRMTAMVDDIGELSALHGVGSTPRDRVSLEDVVSDAIVAVTPLADAAGVQLTGSAGRGIEIDADVRALTRALTNLVRNAVQHTPRGGEVRVVAQAESADGQAVVTVADRCGGIPVGELDHLFEPGWRGDSARTSSDRGLGLGLAIAEAVAEIHGGSVTATNTRDGSGCVFSLALPAMLPG